MAEAASASAAAPGSRSRLRLVSVDLADGSEPDADLRPALARARDFRGDHSRQSGSGAARSGAIGPRPGGDQEDARRIPDPRDPGRSAPQPAHPLQELRSETVLQRRPGMSDGRNVSQPEGF